MKLNTLKFLAAIICTLLTGNNLFAQKQSAAKTPIMGWSSWYAFNIRINDTLIRAEADAMIQKGLKDAGYTYINIDDGYFDTRDENGNLTYDKTRFPNGMKAIADYMHRKGLKAGIYSDAGIITCASRWSKEHKATDAGLYGHDEQDINLFLKLWEFDFIKVDWCGGRNLDLNAEQRYKTIAGYIRAVRNDVVFNICHWSFEPWMATTADSWRISGDIGKTFDSWVKVIDRNADLWKYSVPGHVNDMDNLQVGRGMTFEEDKAQFTMWCMLNSPLVLSGDLRKITDKTLSIVTNKEVIALNQDPLGYQARRIKVYGDLEVWAKPLISTMSGQLGVTLLNRSDKPAKIKLNVDSLGLDISKGYAIRDLWKKQNVISDNKANEQVFELLPHSVIALKITGTARPLNIFQYDKVRY